jgi:hypothetical protein
MSSIANPEPEMPAAEELVAYLDGELPPDDCRRVEQRLAADEDYRQRLRDLDQAWEALDALPASKADDDFARTTMELATLAAQGEVSSQAAGAETQKRRRLRQLAAIGIAATVVGFAAAWVLLPSGNRQLLADLPVIRQVDLLTQIDDVDFLRRLSSDVGAERLMSDETALQAAVADIGKAGDESMETRRHWLESLTTDQKAVLAAQASRFSRTGKQEELRRLESEIRTDADATQLQKTLVAYGQWLDRLSPGEQEDLHDELRELTAEERVDRIDRDIRRETARASRRLSPTDAASLRREVFAIAEEWRERISRRRPDRRDREWLTRLEGPRGALFMLSEQLEDDDRRDQVRERLVRSLSSEMQDHFDELDRRGRWMQLRQWIRQSLEVNSRPDELERFFADDLDSREREWLLSLPSDEMQAQLERLYFGATQLGFRDNQERWQDFRESVGGPPWSPPGDARPGMRPDGPPRGGDRFGAPPPEFDNRGRFDRGPNGPRRPPPGGPTGGRRPPNRPGPPDGTLRPGEPEPI